MKYFIGIILFTTACSTVTLRNPANYQYSDSITCSRSEISALSALSGFMVGPTAYHFAPNLQAPTIRPFFSDGCSSSPDGLPTSKEQNQWTQCCVEHDVRYWMGGTESDKDDADRNLEKCITEKGYPQIAKIYHSFVKHFGGPNTKQTFRWGYGWNYRRPYATINENEIAMASAISPELIQESLAFNKSLVKMCSTEDPIFNKLTQEEQNIYNYLNERLKKNQIIEWAQWGYFNLERREFELKIKTCTNPLKFIFDKKASEVRSLEENCGLTDN